MSHRIVFLDKDFNKISQTAKRSFSSDAKDKCIGPLVNICERTGIIYVTTHFSTLVTEKDIDIPTCVEVKDNCITIDIKNTKDPESLTEKPIARNHWEFWFQPPEKIDTLSLKEIKVNVDFNEKTEENNQYIKTSIIANSFTEMMAFTEIKKLVKDSNPTNDEAAKKVNDEIKKILDCIELGVPKRGTVFIPPK